MNLPGAFEEKMKELLGEEYEEYIACYEEPRYYGMRVNTGKISVEEFEKICPFEIRKIPWIENGFYYDGDKVSPAKHPYYFAGLYYLQEPSAMSVLWQTNNISRTWPPCGVLTAITRQILARRAEKISARRRNNNRV